MADLRKTFKGIMRDWGHDVLLQRIIGHNDLGPVFSDRLERYTTRHRYPNNQTVATVRDEKPEGVVHTADMLYYFQHEARPKSGDRIYEHNDAFDPNRPEDKTVNRKFTTWIVDYALPMKGKGGRVEFWVVGATREEAN